MANYEMQAAGYIMSCLYRIHQRQNWILALCYNFELSLWNIELLWTKLVSAKSGENLVG